MPGSKPVLQALILADFIYEDRLSGKKVISGTYNKIWARSFPTTFGRPTAAFLSLTGIHGHTTIELQFRNLTNHEVVLKCPPIGVEARSPLDSCELNIEVPPFPLRNQGAYSFDVLWDNEIIGSARLIAVEGSTNMRPDVASVNDRPKITALGPEMEPDSDIFGRPPGMEGDPDLINLEWTAPEGKVLSLRAILLPEEEGEFPIYLPALPGVVSQGQSEDEAVENIKEALLGALEEYQASGQEVPWQEDPGDVSPGEVSKWIQVDVG